MYFNNLPDERIDDLLPMCDQEPHVMKVKEERPPRRPHVVFSDVPVL